MKIVESTLHLYALPYARQVSWFNSTETSGIFALLHLVADDGAAGIAESVLKPTWSGVSPRSLRAAIEDLLLPALRAVDVSDPAAVALAMRRFPENFLAKTLIDNACWTLRACAAKQPLWAMLDAVPEAEVSWCVTRQAPKLMAAEAAGMVARHGFRALKVKGGQGLPTDIAALREIRAAVGDAIAFTVDANSAYPAEQAAGYVRAIADAGALIAEDPCRLQPDAAFAALVRDSPIPILVDGPCASLRDAALFLDRGARALSVKPARIGITEVRQVAARATESGANVCSGMYAESALGTLVSLQLSAALKAPLVAAEQSFFLMMTEQVLAIDLHIVDGRIALPDHADYAALVDWQSVARHAL